MSHLLIDCSRMPRWASPFVAMSLLLVAGESGAQSPELAEGSGTPWALKMFSETSHDFGVVAAGSEVTTWITITNNYGETVVISSATPSCSCTRVETPENSVLQPGESTQLVLSMDTVRFRKHKDAVVTVRFSAPSFAEVKIPVQMYVRPDVVLRPGSANFGTVKEDSGATASIEIAYAGFPDRVNWKIVKAKTNNPHLDVKLKETNRSGGGSENVHVTYQLTVRLKPTAPKGSFRGLIQLVTNDASSPSIPVIAEGRIEGEFTITPSKLMLGSVSPGTTKNFNVVIRGRKPFAIEKIECKTEAQAFAARLPEGKRPVHVIPLRYTAPEKPGRYKEVFTVTVAGREEPITFTAVGRIRGEQ